MNIYMMIVTKLNIISGNTVNLKLDDDSKKSRERGFLMAQKLNLEERGFNKNTMQLVIPKTPYKKGTKEHWPDSGLHITISLNGKTKDKNNKVDVITKEMEKFNGLEIDVTLSKNIKFLIGCSDDDEAVGAVFYVAQMVNDSNKLINYIRSIVGLEKINNDSDQHLHISLAAVTPLDGNFTSFRNKYISRDLSKNNRFYSPLDELKIEN